MPYTLKPPPGTPGKAWPAIAVGMFVAFGGVLFGYDTGTIGGILQMGYWLETFGTATGDPTTPYAITTSQTSEIVSILSAGTFFGALLAAPLADTAGRRWALILSAGIVFNLGVILQTAAVTIPVFVAGRFFAGLGVGLVSALIPLYQSETAPKWIRGTIVGSYQLAITIGLLIAAGVDKATGGRNDSGSYRIPIAVQFAWSSILVIGMLILPESPRMYVKRGQPENAARSLSKLRRLPAEHPGVVEELGEITANHEFEMSLGKATYIDCFRGNLGWRLLTGCCLQGLQQLTGVNFIFYYGTTFFTSAGLPGFTESMITSAVNVASTLPGLYLVETWGRRPLLLMGAIGMSVCQFIVAGLGTGYGSSNASAQNGLVAFVCIYIFFFASSWGPCAWVVTGEIFPLKTRAKSLSMTTASNWLLNFAIGYATPYLVNSDPGDAGLGAKVFFIWASFCFICIAFVFGMIYESKGLSLEQVDEMYAKVPHAWQSPGFQPTVSFAEIKELGVQRSGSLVDMEAAAIRKKSVQHDEAIITDEKGL